MLKTDQKQVKTVESIAVYNPQDDWEKAVQDAYHQYNGDWLPSFACQLASKAIARMKCLSDWVDNKPLQFQRACYFFAPHMSSHKERLVFPTFPLFWYNIQENHEIDAYLHDPITFVTLPIANYLLRDYPIHVVVDYSILQRDNSAIDFVDIGGLLVASGRDIKLSPEAIITVAEMEDTPTLRKAAATEISKDVFKIDEHKRVLRPDSEIWDKLHRRKAKIDLVDPGENGEVHIKYDEGDELSIPIGMFDQRYVVTKVAQSLPGSKVEEAIKQRLRQSKAIQHLFEDFEVDFDRLDDLRIVVANLDKKYAETDAQTMKLDLSLFEGDFFEDYFFVVVHEIVHWLSRIKEQDAYFNDPEEVLGFVAAIAYELEKGGDTEAAWLKIYPKISWHFHSEADARQFFDNSLEKATKIISSQV